MADKTSFRIQEYMSNLRGRSDEVRVKTALEFSKYVNDQIREATEPEVAAFMNEFSQVRAKLG
jgi:hypothetical protein